MPDQARGYHPITRWLHAGLVLGIISQLSLAALMTEPSISGASQSTTGTGFFMQTHRTLGILVAVIVCANLVWALIPRGDPPLRQIAVLYSWKYWREALSIARGIPWILSGRHPMPAMGNALSMIFEMLGLLLMSAMAMTGTLIWFTWQPGVPVSRLAGFLMQVHAFIVPALLFYLSGHITMAFLHALRGDRIFSGIVPFGNRRKKGMD